MYDIPTDPSQPSSDDGRRRQQSILLRDVVDAVIPGLHVGRIEGQYTASGAIDLDGVHSRRVSLSFSAPDRLMRLDAKLGKLPDLTLKQALGLLALCPRLCSVWRDAEDGTLFVRAAAPARSLNAARFVLRALVQDLRATLVSEQLAVALRAAAGSGRGEVTP